MAITRWTIGAALVVLAGAMLTVAGPLNPPAGPVASTYKTLSDIEPRIPVDTLSGTALASFVISQPGSYYLTGNITGVSGRRGISITASNVTLDLNGFTLLGVAGSLDGINAASSIIGQNLTNIRIHNGVIRAWGGAGIVMPLTENCRVEEIVASNNTQHGIRLGFRSSIARCTARANGPAGIDAINDTSITDCTSSNNTGAGFRVDTSVVLLRCVARQNAQQGITGGIGCAVVDCTADGNTGIGIDLLDGGAVLSCTATDNAGIGIATDSGGAIGSCTSRRNGAGGNFRSGIEAGGAGGAGPEMGGCAVVDCLATGSGLYSGFSIRYGSAMSGCVSTANSFGGIFGAPGCVFYRCDGSGNPGQGFSIGDSSAAIECRAASNTHTGSNSGLGIIGGGFSQTTGTLIARCSAYLNDDNGINTGQGSLVLDCEATGSNTFGFSTFGSCLVLRNHVRGCANGFAYQGSDSRFQSNHAAFCTTGYNTHGLSSDNLFIRNSAAQNNTQYNLPATERPFTITSNPNTANGWDNFSMP